MHGGVVWRRLNPLFEISAENGSETILKHLFAFSLRTT